MKICSFDNCTNEGLTKFKGFCKKHYMVLWRAANKDKLKIYRKRSVERNKERYKIDEEYREHRKVKNKEFKQKHKQEIAIKNKEYRRLNRDRREKYNRQWLEKRPEYMKEYKKIWGGKHPDYNRIVYHERTKFKPYRLKAISLRIKLSRFVRGEIRTDTIEYLGIGREDFKKYIEARFYIRKNGEQMSWNNRGNKGWHLDHIIPLINFDLFNEDDLKKACHYTNIQPLWMEDNLSKGKKLFRQ